MESFNKRVSKILSNNIHSLNQSDHIVVKSVSKQQYVQNQLQKKKKILQKKIENDRYLLVSGYQKMIKKFNNNLMLLSKIVLENKKIEESLLSHPKINHKVAKLRQFENKLVNVRQFLIQYSDLDQETINQIVNKR